MKPYRDPSNTLAQLASAEAITFETVKDFDAQGFNVTPGVHDELLLVARPGKKYHCLKETCGRRTSLALRPNN